MTPDIRELLEDAARAFGIKGGVYVENFGGHDQWYTGNTWGIKFHVPLAGDAVWNPITNDADCKRMEDALAGQSDNFYIHCNRLVVAVTCVKNGAVTYAEENLSDHNGSRSAARNMASTRVAAAIGKGMK